MSERLLRISDGSTNNNGQGSEIARYAYDPFGRRIAKTVSQNTSGQGSPGTTLYFYADEGLIAEVDGNSSGGNITTTYGWMPNGTWGTAPQWKRDHAGQSGATDVQGSANTNGITHYVHVDHLGTSQRLTNTQGETTWRAVSEAFGKTLIDTTLAPATTGTTTNNLRFPGQYEDQETATHYNYMRTYLPMVGRYGESDPVGLGGGINTYAYVNNQPSTVIDPYGEAPLILVPVVFCARFPGICRSIFLCLRNPERCKRTFCKLGNTLYKGFCSVPGCLPCDECATAAVKAAAAEACVFLRTAVRTICYSSDRSRSGENHEVEIAKAQVKFQDCMVIVASKCAGRSY